MEDVPGRNQLGPAIHDRVEHKGAPNQRGEALDRLDSVLERHDHCVGSARPFEPLRRASRLVGLDADEYPVEGLAA